MNQSLSQSRWQEIKGAFRRVPAFVLNAASAAVGVGVVGLLVAATGSQTHAQWAIAGALCVSLSDMPNTVHRIRQRVMLALVLSVLAALVVQTSRWSEPILVLGLFGIGFVATMTMSWGAWANTVSFAVLLSTVFTMAAPQNLAVPWHVAAWSGLGGLLYWLWAVLTSPLLQRRYGTQALSDAVLAVAEQLRVRAALLQASHERGVPLAEMNEWLRGEATLAERLQAARNFVFVERDSLQGQRHSAILLWAIELRDILLASRLDLDLVGVDQVGRSILKQLASALRALAAALDDSAKELQDGAPHDKLGALDFSKLFDDILFAEEDKRRRLVPSLYDRLENLATGVNGIRQLLRCVPGDPVLQRQDLERFVVPESWPLRVIKEQLHWKSPVLRFAMRLSIAICSGYVLARTLPWASHPYWVVLTIGVVLRGNLAQTLDRRNARVMGTLLGCAVVALASVVQPQYALELVFLTAVGVAHAFITRRYWITAVAATVLALLQSHFIAPSGGFAIAERAADTVFGALLGWGFSFVLPSWERRQLPDAVKQAIGDIGMYADQVLRATPLNVVVLRMARRKAYDSLVAISDSVQRGSAEPDGVKAPLKEVAAFLDYGQRLMAHLSMVRIMLASNAAELDRRTAALRLSKANQSVKHILLNDGATGSSDDGLQDNDRLVPLPQEGPRKNALPWLERRLDILVNDASRTRSAAKAILELNVRD